MIDPPMLCDHCGCNTFKSNERAGTREKYWTCLRCEVEPPLGPELMGSVSHFAEIACLDEYVSVYRTTLHALLSDIVRENAPVGWVRFAKKMLESKEMKPL